MQLSDGRIKGEMFISGYKVPRGLCTDLDLYKTLGLQSLGLLQSSRSFPKALGVLQSPSALRGFIDTYMHTYTYFDSF